MYVVERTSACSWISGPTVNLVSPHTYKSNIHTGVFSVLSSKQNECLEVPYFGGQELYYSNI